MVTASPASRRVLDNSQLADNAETLKLAFKVVKLHKLA